MRLIDADELAIKFRMVAEDPWNKSTSTTWANAYEECADEVDEFPTADVVERKYGVWEVAMFDHESMGHRPKAHYCSVCNYITTFRTLFCPNCGADMRKEAEDG